MPDVGTWLEHNPGEPWLLEASERLAGGEWDLARVAAKMLIAQGMIHVTHPNRESVAKVADDIRTAARWYATTKKAGRRKP